MKEPFEGFVWLKLAEGCLARDTKEAEGFPAGGENRFRDHDASRSMLHESMPKLFWQAIE